MCETCESQTKQLEHKDLLTRRLISTSFYHHNTTGRHLHHVEKKLNKYLQTNSL